MIKRLIVGAVVSLLVVVLPVFGNREILLTPHIWILCLTGLLASVFQPGYNPFTITVKSGDRGTGAQIIWSVYVTQLAAVLEAAYWRYPASVRWDPAAGLALVAMAAGLALRTWAVLTLGNLFTMHLDIREGHSIVRTGPYRWIRHPSYLGAFILYMATIVFFHAWYSLAAAILLLPSAFLRRIHYEEELLACEFGEPYEIYRREVKKIVPGLW